MSGDRDVDEPGIPFPTKTVEDAMCRDCPFPAAEAGLNDFQRNKIDEWIKDVLKRLEGETWRPSLPIIPDPGNRPDLSALKGLKLKVLHPGDARTLEFGIDRVTIVVDARNSITSVSYT